MPSSASTMVRMAATEDARRARVGLTSAEVDDRVRRGLVNRERPPVDRTYWRILLDHALPPINVALYAISASLLLMGLEVDALVTAGPVLGYVLVGIWQETRAKRQLDRITLLHRPRATVLRDGAEASVATSAIVMGDHLVLRRGDEVTVDGVVVAGEIEVDEAILTGESDPVARSVGDRVSSGCACVSGEAIVEADRIGEAGASATMLRAARAIRVERTPVQRTLQRVILAVTLIVALAGTVVAVRLIGSDASLADGARATAVLVALVPQGLLVVVTITYAMGALQITRQGAVVQRISSIEAMSHVDTLCVDKTGTLTTGRIRLADSQALGGTSDLAAVAASMEPPNPTLMAIRAAFPAAARPTAWQVAFSSARRWSALSFTDDHRTVHVLGAPDALLPAIAESQRTGIERRVAAMTSAGRRVLLHARGPAHSGPPRGLPAPLAPVTLLGFSEEVRPDARQILDEIADAGAQLKMISGDDPRTLQAVATAAGLTSLIPAVAAADVASDEAAVRALERGCLFGRVDPESKARFIGLLRAAGRYVGMIGDGVNDILALKRAQLGIAMESGSPATRAVADIVLLRDDFRLLPAILRAGQRVVSAMMVTLELLLARTSSMIVIVSVAAVLALPFPFTPRNNSLLALLTVGIPTIVLALVVAPARPPAHILRSSLRFALPSGVGMALPALAVYAGVLAGTGDVPMARTALVEVTVLFGIGLITLVATRWTRPIVARAERWRVWALAAAMALAFVVVLALGPGRSFFELAEMDIGTHALLAAVGVGWTIGAHMVTGWVGWLIATVERRMPNGRRARPAAPAGG